MCTISFFSTTSIVLLFFKLIKSICCKLTVQRYYRINPKHNVTMKIKNPLKFLNLRGLEGSVISNSLLILFL
nr:MAG TPA: hypothetical protein [Bacteriophage sp.]